MLKRSFAMSEKKLHCHVQIEYCVKGNDCPEVESLIGFDPTSEEDRALCHKMLDEYLDVWVKRFAANPNASLLEYKEEGFHIFPEADK